MEKDNNVASDSFLQNQYVKNTSSFNRLNSSSPYNGTSDKFSDIRIRLAVIDNPESQRGQYEEIDPLDVKNVINTNNGKVTLKWVDSPGGIIRSQNVGGEWIYKQEKDKYNPEDRDFQEWNITSQREQVALGHPFIWANNDNYCGFNYLPPVGSTVVVGFRKQGLPIILGYVQTHYQICKPPLKPGEMVLKGYGNNYIHNRWSDKIDIKAWSEEGKPDLDDPSNKKTNKSNCTLWIRLNANDRYIELISSENGNGNGNDNNLNKYPYEIKGESSSKVVINPTSVLIETNGEKKTTYYQEHNLVTITTNEFTVNADNIHMNANENITSIAGNNITDNASNDSIIISGNNTEINTGDHTGIYSGGIIDEKASRINLN